MPSERARSRASSFRLADLDVAQDHGGHRQDAGVDCARYAHRHPGEAS